MTEFNDDALGDIPEDTTPTDVSIDSNAAAQLRSLIDRIERLEEEKSGLQDDIKSVYDEAKSAGFDTKIMRHLIRIRKMDQAEREEQEELLEIYLSAVGM